MPTNRAIDDLSHNFNNGQNPGVSYPLQTSSSIGQGIDYNHPFFLSPIDISGISIISFQCLGVKNYTLWSRSITLALLGKNKIGIVDGSCRKEVYNEELWGQWERVNAIVLSWFDRIDGSRTYNVQKEIVSLQQGTNSVSMYYTKLKTLWDEFLMGFNESYHQARGKILMMDPLPTINHACVMIVGDESQKAIVSHIGSMGLNSVSMDSVAMYSKIGSSSGLNQRFKKNSLLVCDFYKCKGHSKEFYYKIVGYPPDFKSKRKVQGAPSEVTSSGSHNSSQAHFSYGMNTNVQVLGRRRKSDSSHIHQGGVGSSSSTHYSRQVSQAELEVKQLLKGFNFTKDQYDHILKGYHQNTYPTSPYCSATFVAHTAGKMFRRGSIETAERNAQKGHSRR
ncbi:hypothetical protein KY290_025969 [Solanum tuberosum]|uniref:Retrotransposon Copia-like N-terminal domain-containing protein n=1 Tax=Solanum tuberosum TaxID=4113 RepID=A0ABQ7UV21_SOLTU|nr:hypothetical protein KY284_024833 [Solanum tuberosum]KAH0677875.1 hypothetical protein KY285_025676 [Solanum tuberosum]KAH0755699.1 hypothetical protein KY290_025969 [Solanum tuberosum]